MSTRTTNDWHGIAALVLLLVALPVGYVLSAGPAAWLGNHGYVNIDYVFALYDPLFEMTGKHFIGRLIGYYIGWWID